MWMHAHTQTYARVDAIMFGLWLLGTLVESLGNVALSRGLQFLATEAVHSFPLLEWLGWLQVTCELVLILHRLYGCNLYRGIFCTCDFIILPCTSFTSELEETLIHLLYRLNSDDYYVLSSILPSPPPHTHTSIHEVEWAVWILLQRTIGTYRHGSRSGQESSMLGLLPSSRQTLVGQHHWWTVPGESFDLRKRWRNSWCFIQGWLQSSK